MKIWSDTITGEDISNAADRAHVQAYGLIPFKAQKRKQRWELYLTGDSPYRPNTGTWGQDTPGEHAATWDQWGIFLNALFEADPNMTTQYYATATDFHVITGFRFETLTYPYSHRVHKWKWDGGSGMVCEFCDAVRNYGIPAA